jgi:hypothetical protein
MTFVFNLLLGLLLAASRLFRSHSVSTAKSKPKPPRRPTLAVINASVPDDVFALIRMSWFKQGRPVEVEEFQIFECDDAYAIFHGTVGQALRQRADVSVITTYSAEALGIPTEAR